MKKVLSVFCVALVCALLLPGCPPPPPFSATGAYEGTWNYAIGIAGVQWFGFNGTFDVSRAS